MGTPLGPKYIPYFHMDPLGNVGIGGSRGGRAADLPPAPESSYHIVFCSFHFLLHYPYIRYIRPLYNHYRYHHHGHFHPD